MAGRPDLPNRHMLFEEDSIVNRSRTLLTPLFVIVLLATDIQAGEQPLPSIPLLQAAGQGNVEQIRLHIARGTDVNKVGDRGRTPLAAAMQAGHVEAVRLLLDAGADANADTPFGPPLVMAASRANLELIELLLSKGANPNVTDGSGRTALIAATELRAKPLVELLIAKGADLNVTDRQGRTALSVASRNRDDEISELLRSHGAQEPTNTFERDPYGGAGMAASMTQASSYRTRNAQPQILADPNAIRTRLQSFPDVAQALNVFDANNAPEERAWASRRSDNRTTLIRTVARQFADEMAYLKRVATGEKATQTVSAIDELATKRVARYEAIGSELREQRRASLEETRESTGRSRGRTSGRTSRGRTSRGAIEGYGGQMEADPTGPYATGRPARPSSRDEAQADEPVLDAETQDQIQAWLGANPEDKRTLLNEVHAMDLAELEALHETATEEKATKTIAAIEGFMLARQGRLERITTKMAEEDERLQRIAEREALTGGTRGRTTGQEPTQPTTSARRGRRR